MTLVRARRERLHSSRLIRLSRRRCRLSRGRVTLEGGLFLHRGADSGLALCGSHGAAKIHVDGDKASLLDTGLPDRSTLLGGDNREGQEGHKVPGH